MFVIKGENKNLHKSKGSIFDVFIPHEEIIKNNNKSNYSPGQCVSVDSSIILYPKVCGFDSRSGSRPGLRV